ncbi:hypothetical protein Y1Q_0006829 [Alligator mississippiensis]|uniref:Uncharacterized protein n=1 Tax=Alligator mississippiensis TaxID=8496 RepID=A0A151M5R5_ALLMI|nr:hypothetical protein Y1Q_0006829 [Alligator mississippiensis]
MEPQTPASAAAADPAAQSGALTGPRQQGFSTPLITVKTSKILWQSFPEGPTTQAGKHDPRLLLDQEQARS